MTTNFSIEDVKRCAESAPDIASATPDDTWQIEAEDSSGPRTQPNADPEIVRVTAGKWGDKPAWEFRGKVIELNLDGDSVPMVAKRIRVALRAQFINVESVSEGAAAIHALWTIKPK